jgi:hypothetical protein
MIVESRSRPCPGSYASESPDALIEEARQWQRRRRLRFIIAAVVLAALGSAIYGGFGGSPNPPPTIPVIERNLASALARSQTTLMLRVGYHRTTPPCDKDACRYVTAVEWVDLANGDQRWLDYDASGRLKIDTARTYSGTASETASGFDPQNTLTVTYDSETWSVSSGTLECGGGGRGCPVPPKPNGACNCDLDPFTNFGTKPHVSLLGKQTIDRQPTFHLRFTIAGGPFASTTDFWINRSTYLPVHLKLVAPKTSVKNSLRPYAVTNDFTWLPRTSANLADLAPTIPRGFKRSNPNP